MDTVNKKRRLPMSISWDYLENAFVCDQGYCYKTIKDIPEAFRHLVEVETELYCLHQSNNQRQKTIDRATTTS